MGKGYSLKVILVPVAEVANTLGSGDTRLVKDILRDKKKKQFFDQLEVKRPFVFNIEPVGKKRPSIVEDEILDAAEPFRTVPQCIKQLLQPNDYSINQQQPAADDGDQTQTSGYDEDDTTRHEDECFIFEQNIADMGMPPTPIITSGKKKKKKRSSSSSSKYDFENDSNDLDGRIGYKYMYALEAIVAKCPSARYLNNERPSRWTNFRPGFISDVQVHGFKTGIDLDWHQILERGVPDCWNAKKQFPKLLDYPTIGYLKYTEMADIVCRLIPDDDDAGDGVDGDLDDDRHRDHTHVHNEAIAEFKDWIETSITECKDLIFFIY